MLSTAIRNALPKEVLTHLATAHTRRISLKQVYALSRHVLAGAPPESLLVPATFLHAELPVRLTHTLSLLTDPQLPPTLANLPSIQHSTSRYLQDLQDLTALPPPSTPEDEEAFAVLLRRLRQRQRETILEVGSGFRHLLRTGGQETNGAHRRRFLDAFYASQLGVRLLIGQHLALREGRSLVQRLSPLVQVNSAVDRARERCIARFGTAPPMRIIAPSPEMSIIHVEEHLSAILEGIIGRAMGATCKRHLPNGTSDPALGSIPTSPPPTVSAAVTASLPPVELVLAAGRKDVTIKVSDEGGGFSSRQGHKLWRYTWPDGEGRGLDALLPEETVRLPVDGECHGLPIARLTARYFGGDLDIVWMEGQGSMAYVSLTRDAQHLEEIPSFDQLEDDDPLSTLRGYVPTHIDPEIVSSAN